MLRICVAFEQLSVLPRASVFRSVQNFHSFIDASVPDFAHPLSPPCGNSLWRSRAVAKVRSRGIFQRARLFEIQN